MDGRVAPARIARVSRAPAPALRARRAAAAPAAGRAAAPDALADPPVFVLFNEIGIIDQLARNRFERVMPHGLSVAQFSLLNHFVRIPGERSLVALARAFQVSKPAMGKLVRRLDDQGLLAVRDDPDDGRGKRVGLTAAGRRARQDAIAALAPEVARLQAALGDDAIRALLPGLQRVRSWLDSHR